MLSFDIDDTGSEDMGVEIYCDRGGEPLVDVDFIGIHLYSDTGSGCCHFEGTNIDKLIAAFEAIKKELRPHGIKEGEQLRPTPACFNSRSGRGL